jgi:hypothetical protein
MERGRGLRVLRSPWPSMRSRMRARQGDGPSHTVSVSLVESVQPLPGRDRGVLHSLDRSPALARGGRFDRSKPVEAAGPAWPTEGHEDVADTGLLTAS